MVILILVGTIADLAYSFIASFVMNFLGIIPDRPVGNLGIEILNWYFLPTILFRATIEELIFRFPLSCAVITWGVSKKVLGAALVSSLIFGFLHGGCTNFGFIYEGVHHIFLQGVGGLFYCLLYLKCGGLNKRFLKPIVVTTIAHATYNSAVALIVLCFGSRYM
jgi:membrane protease YdiL (CAAX protease family)